MAPDASEPTNGTWWSILVSVVTVLGALGSAVIAVTAIKGIPTTVLLLFGCALVSFSLGMLTRGRLGTSKGAASLVATMTCLAVGLIVLIGGVVNLSPSSSQAGLGPTIETAPSSLTTSLAAPTVTSTANGTLSPVALTSILPSAGPDGWRVDNTQMGDGLRGGIRELSICGLGTIVPPGHPVEVRRVFINSKTPAERLGVEAVSFDTGGATQFMDHVRQALSSCQAQASALVASGMPTVSVRGGQPLGEDTFYIGIGDYDLILFRGGQTVVEVFYANTHDAAHQTTADSYAMQATQHLYKAVTAP